LASSRHPVLDFCSQLITKFPTPLQSTLSIGESGPLNSNPYQCWLEYYKWRAYAGLYNPLDHYAEGLQHIYKEVIGIEALTFSWDSSKFANNSCQHVSSFVDLCRFIFIGRPNPVRKETKKTLQRRAYNYPILLQLLCYPRLILHVFFPNYQE